MYCGDETGSFVGDVGSHVSRFGYGGDDSPKFVVPSYTATTATTSTTTTTTNNNNGTSSSSVVRKVSVPTSCYNSRWARDNVEFQSALRMANVVDVDNKSNNLELLRQQPVVDPTQYLQQGDSIQCFDAYENLWQTAFDAMKVRDRLKHTKGGGRIVDDSNTTSSATGDDNKQPASTTIRSPTAFLDTKCIHPLLAVSPGCTYRVGAGTANTAMHRNNKEMAKITEILFEKLDAPAVFIAPAPMLAAFSHGRQTALVVDIGAAGCRVTPVVDGLVLHQSQRRNGRGGDWLGNVQWQAMKELQKNVLLRPRYYQQGQKKLYESMTTGTTTGDAGTASAAMGARFNNNGRGIFHRWAMQDLMYEFRSSQHVKVPEWKAANSIATTDNKYNVPFMYSNEDSDAENEQEGEQQQDDEGDKMEIDSPPPGEAAASTTSTTTTTPSKESNTYELPDGTLIDLTTRVGRDLCRVPELLFTNELPFLTSSGVDESILNQHDTLSNLPLHQLIRSSLSAVADVDVRKDLASSILLTGASSLIPNLEQRLSAEVGQIISSAFKPKVLASRQAVERSCASWIGGSILTSLGSFQQLWLGRSEYEEYGATLAVQRFP